VKLSNIKRLLLSYALLLLSLVVAIPIVHWSDAGALLTRIEAPVDDLPNIAKRGKLVAITSNNSINYFIYRGRPMGFHYELLREFAAEHDLNLEMKIGSDIEAMEQSLLEGECDIIAAGFPVTRELSNRLAFTQPILQSRQVLVQRKPDDWRKLSKKELEDSILRNQIELGGSTVHIISNEAISRRLHSLSDEIGDSIHVVEVDSLDAESIIEAVAVGQIRYTVTDELEALVAATYHPELDVLTDVSYPQNLAWAIKPGADSLLTALNEWLAEFMSTRKYKALYNRYFVQYRSLGFEDREERVRGGRRKISPYDKEIKLVSAEFGWDWRLVASIIYQESHFNPEAVNEWSGAFGLMQLMPGTAENYGVTPTSTPEEQIRAGLRFLRYVDRQIPVEVNDRLERQKFIIASYNSGPGHVLDARRLAEKFDADPNRWDENVETWLLRKSESKYHSDPVVRNGYFRGRETVKFVKEVLQRYEHYKSMTDK
jgi:membrane-bound lytic murein transglycosylase F